MQSGVRRRNFRAWQRRRRTRVCVSEKRARPQRCGALIARHKISLDPQVPDQWIGREAFLASFSALFSFMVLAGFFLASFF
jgi:hypothetical protein